MYFILLVAKSCCDSNIEIMHDCNLLGPRDANVDDAGNAEDQDHAGDDDQRVREYLTAKRDRSLCSHRLRWHHGCVNVDGVRSH